MIPTLIHIARWGAAVELLHVSAASIRIARKVAPRP